MGRAFTSCLAGLFWPRVSQEIVVRCQLELFEGSCGIRGSSPRAHSRGWEVGARPLFFMWASPWDCWSVLRTWQLAPLRAGSSKEKEPGGSWILFGIQLWKSRSIPSAPFRSLKMSYHVWFWFKGRELLSIYLRGKCQRIHGHIYKCLI